MVVYRPVPIFRARPLAIPSLRSFLVDCINQKIRLRRPHLVRSRQKKKSPRRVNGLKCAEVDHTSHPNLSLVFPASRKGPVNLCVL
jgi:hypothetical protein